MGRLRKDGAPVQIEMEIRRIKPAFYTQTVSVSRRHGFLNDKMGLFFEITLAIESNICMFIPLLNEQHYWGIV